MKMTKAISALGLCLAASACTGEQPLPPGVRGVTHVDAGTDYVYLNKPTSISGACSGWNTVLIAKRGDRATGRTWEMCWKEDGGTLRVTTEKGDSPQSAPIDTMLDIKGSG